MKEIRYMISDAAKKVQVEAHVLRYWEEELDLQIARNEMGHRYYTDRDVVIFRNIKKLKDQGFQLKAIKMVLPELESSDVDKLLLMREELNTKADKLEQQTEVTVGENSVVTTVEQQAPVNMNDKMQQFQMILGKLVGQAIRDNNMELSKEISGRVSDNVIKEMDYLIRLQDEREEERFKKLDEIIRNYQKSRKEVAAVENDTKKKKSRRHFLRKNKVMNTETAV